MKAMLVLLLAIAAAGCARPAREVPRPEPPSRGSVPETSVGLAQGSLFDVQEPPRVVPNETAPGELPVSPRPYPGAPPVIPHGVAEFLPITAETNACVTCHEVNEKEEGGPTPIPASHYVDLRHAPGRKGDSVVGARNDCTLCHAPQTTAPSLVGNRF